MKTTELRTNFNSIESMLRQVDILDDIIDGNPLLNGNKNTSFLSFEESNELELALHNVRMKLQLAKEAAEAQYYANVYQFIHTNNKGYCTRFHGTKDEIIQYWQSVAKDAIVLELYFNDSRAPICGHNDIGKFLFGK